MLSKAETVISRFSNWVGYTAASLLLLLVGLVFINVIKRYLINDVSIGLQELEWHLYSAIFLLGVAYALHTDGHVRVDIIYERLSPQRRAIIDIAGVLIFVWPFCILVASYGIGFAQEAYQIGETSGDPGGLPYRWIIKSLISLSFILVIISSLGFILRALREYRGLAVNHADQTHLNL